MLMQVYPKAPHDEEEVPGIVGIDDIATYSEDIHVPPMAYPNIKPIPPQAKTFHDHYASRLVMGCIVTYVAIWVLDYFFTFESSLTAPVTELLKTVTTTCLGYLFAAHQIRDKDK